MTRLALHVDRRKSVRGLSEMFDTLITAPSGVEEQSPSGDAAAETFPLMRVNLKTVCLTAT